MIAEIAAGIRLGINFLQPSKDKTEEVVNFGSITAKNNGLKDWEKMFIPNPEVNLAAAKKLGMGPLTFADILAQLHSDNLPLTVDELPYMVFTDKVPDLPANYWRIETLDLGKGIVHLQLGSPNGYQDIVKVGPLHLPITSSFFTGIRSHDYRDGDERIPLSVMAARYNETGKGIAYFRDEEPIEYFGETRYWSNKQGLLVPSSQHPLSSIGMLTAK